MREIKLLVTVQVDECDPDAKIDQSTMQQDQPPAHAGGWVLRGRKHPVWVEFICTSSRRSRINNHPNQRKGVSNSLQTNAVEATTINKG
jgi:hypothetical protein